MKLFWKMNLNRTFFLPFLLVGASLIFQGCKKSQDKTLAKVGRIKISQQDFSKELSNSPQIYLNYLSTLEGKKQFLDILLKEKVLLNSARNSGVASNKQVQKEMQQYVERAKEQEEHFRKGLILREYLKQLQDGRLKVEDQEIKDYFEKNKAEFESPAKVVASHILSSSEEEAQKALQRLKKGEDFAKVAREVSKDPSASRGGLIGEVMRNDLSDLPSFEQALFSLKTGEISDVVKTKIGYHIIKKNGEQRLPGQSYAQAVPQIRRVLEKKKFEDWMESEKKNQKVWIDEQVLASISLPQAEEPSSQNLIRP
ncbi:MAG: peptidylprolyl isomerase [Elusimicrobia bacterium]|nr:peptidylprolyl isomerase [Elusimicrobiota bacterium]